jgi:hypothetical protein
VPVDPRLNSLVEFVSAEMAHPGAGVHADTAHRIAALEARIASLERAATVQIGAGVPAQPARDGTLYGQTTNTLWLRINSAWRGVNLPL